MELKTTGIAGTMESGDILIEMEPQSSGGISLELNSIVSSQFGRRIREVIEETLRECGVENALVHAVDKGALDCTIRARVSAAAYRGAERTDFQWK